jgi:hypothetical protein
MEEEQVDAVPGVADAEPALTADEREVATELKEERLEVPDERLLDVGSESSAGSRCDRKAWLSISGSASRAAARACAPLPSALEERQYFLKL